MTKWQFGKMWQEAVLAYCQVAYYPITHLQWFNKATEDLRIPDEFQAGPLPNKQREYSSVT
jgi:hypothetical protein